jgi:hypothetical protein
MALFAKNTAEMDFKKKPANDLLIAFSGFSYIIPFDLRNTVRTRM